MIRHVGLRAQLSTSPDAKLTWPFVAFCNELFIKVTL